MRIKYWLITCRFTNCNSSGFKDECGSCGLVFLLTWMAKFVCDSIITVNGAGVIPGRHSWQKTNKQTKSTQMETTFPTIPKHQHVIEWCSKLAQVFGGPGGGGTSLLKYAHNVPSVIERWGGGWHTAPLWTLAHLLEQDWQCVPPPFPTIPASSISRQDPGETDGWGNWDEWHHPPSRATLLLLLLLLPGVQVTATTTTTIICCCCYYYYYLPILLLLLLPTYLYYYYYCYLGAAHPEMLPVQTQSISVDPRDLSNKKCKLSRGWIWGFLVTVWKALGESPGSWWQLRLCKGSCLVVESKRWKLLYAKKAERI